MAKKVGPGSIFKGSSRFSKKGNSSTTSNNDTVAGSSSAFGGTRGFGQTSPPPQATSSVQSDNTSDSPFSGDDSFGATDAFGSSNPQNERSQSTSVPIDDSPFGGSSANQSSAFGQSGDSNLGGTIYTSNTTSSGQRVSPVGEIPQATAAATSEKDDARVFLRRSDVEMKRNSIFSWLIGIFKLDVYGTQNLTRRALFSMQMASLILLVIFIFDLALWFVLFN